MTTLIKSKQVQIQLGNIFLDVFQLPSSEYRLSKKQTCDVVDLNRKRLSELFEKKSLQSLLGEGRSLSEFVVKAKLQIENGSTSNETYDLVPISFATALWLETGSLIGKQLAYAAILESIERRADAAFGVVRKEEERNNWFTFRMEQSKIFRRSLTDAMLDRELVTGEKAEYGFATLRVYRRVGIFDRYMLFKREGRKDFKSILTLGELEDLRSCEEFVAKLMRKRNICVNNAIDIYKEIFPD